MSRSDRRWARFYYDDFQRDYPDVYADDAALAAWLRLLVIAERAWPAPAELPRSVQARALRVLTSSGLVTLGVRHTFAVRGHDAERTARSAAGYAGASARWDANASAIAMPRRERDENKTSTPLPHRVGRRVNGTNPRATGANPRAQGTSPRQVREQEKRGPSSLHEILTSIQTKGKA